MLNSQSSEEKNKRLYASSFPMKELNCNKNCINDCSKNLGHGSNIHFFKMLLFKDSFSI